MATEESFIKHVMVQADLGSRFTYRKMFGEYGFHLDGKFVALACDNSFFIKHTAAISENGLELPTQAPYPGAKEYPVADELLDTPEILRLVLLDTAAFLPEPKPKRSTKRKV
jgi:TfoX/Sxy family transcriptional regulator of competence genes